MKKTICFLLICLALFTGCDKSENETTVPKEETTTVETSANEKETDTDTSEEETTPFWNEEETIELPPIKF